MVEFIGIFMMLSQEILLPFSLEWGTGTLSCGFWYLMILIIFDSDDSCGCCNEVVQEGKEICITR